MQNDKLKEECGVFAVCDGMSEAAKISYNALISLQHRGQESAGIAVLNEGSILYHKNSGLVSEVFNPTVLSKLPKSKMAIGHVRYSTTGNSSSKNAQPIITEYFKGRIATAHNGNIINATEIKNYLLDIGCNFSTTNDSEVISSLIAYEALSSATIEEAVEKAVKQLKGAFTLVILSSRNKILAVRDGWGFRPLCVGKNENGYAVASESCALDSCGFEFLYDVKPGEMVVIDETGITEKRMICPQETKGLCIFEYVYFARPDSFIDGASVYRARYNAGVELAKQHPADADIVCGVPDSGLDAAVGYAAQSGLPCASAFVKNRYIGRSFIFPTQGERESAVRIKLNPLKANVENKRVVLIDDSIVRGTTSALIIKSLKQAGAKEVHLRISSPPFIFPCHFGTDIDDTKKLLANQMNIDEIAKTIGADSLGYIDTQGLISACRECSVSLCTGCFTGKYPVEVTEPHTHCKNSLEK